MRWRDFDDLPPLQPAFFDLPRRVHFVGIGGIGMSALAKLLASRGHQVSGSDANETPALVSLREVGIKAVAGHNATNLHLWDAPAEALVFSSAVREDNPERQEAERLNVPQYHRGQILAYFVNTAETSIAVSGTHGKSTTSAMVAHILETCGCKPTAILGATYPPFGGNLLIGDPDLVVVEADESDGSFTLLRPSVAVVTNVEPEHLENYEDSEEELWRAFLMFVTGAGHRLLCANDERLCHRIPHRAFDRFGVDRVAALVKATNLRGESGRTVFYFECMETDGTFYLPLPGRHNVTNAMGAVAATLCINLDELDWKGASFEARDDFVLERVEALKTFNGIARRFEKKGEAGGVTVYDDYAHHPTEVRATLEAARDFLGRPITVIFQPHRYSRTAQMGREFGPAFQDADRVIITQLYSAFEEPIEGVSGRIVFDALREALPHLPASYAETLDEARRMAVEGASEGDVIFTMGAGDVSKLGPLLLQDLSASTAEAA